MSKYPWEGSDGGNQHAAHEHGKHANPGADPQVQPGAPGPAQEQTEPPPRTLEHALDAIDRLNEEIAAKDAELAQTKDRLLREHADLENFKRRMQREKSEALRYASEHLLRDLLPVIDNLQRAVDAAGGAPGGESREQSSRVEGLVTGVKMVLQQFTETLGRFGVTRVAAAGHSFDPTHHEAVAHVETDQHQAGAVVDEHASGYRLHDRLLRPAQVTVAKPRS